MISDWKTRWHSEMGETTSACSVMLPIGVAMGQAEKDVKAAADYVTAPIDEDGISKAMIHFGII